MKNINNIKTALDLDTIINVINNDPEHIRRAKEKAERIKKQRNAEIIKSAQKAQRQKDIEKKKAQRQEARQRDIDDKTTLAVLVTATTFVSQIIAMMF